MMYSNNKFLLLKICLNEIYEIIKFFIEINEEKRQEHIQQTKDNPLTRWKVQEYSNVLSTDIYLKDMRQFIK